MSTETKDLLKNITSNAIGNVIGAGALILIALFAGKINLIIVYWKEISFSFLLIFMTITLVVWFRKLIKIEKEVETIKKTLQINEETKKNNEEKKWEVDYEEFKLNPISKSFEKILEVIHGKNGEIFDGEMRNIDLDSIIYFSVFDLIRYKNPPKNTIIDLTRKGTFFAQKYKYNFNS
jgi:hypothetical protein